MATSAQVIVEAGMAKATGNDPGKLNSDGEVLNRLNRVFLALYALAARQRPDPYSSTSDLTFSGNPAQCVLASAASPALTDVIEIRYLKGKTGGVAAGAKVHLVSETEAQKTYQIAPCVFQRGLAIVSRAAAGDPVAADVLTATVLDNPTPLTTLAINIDTRFPQRHHEILVNDVALYLDAKDEGRDAGAFQKLQADQRRAMMAFANEYSLNASALEQILNDRVPAVPAGA